MNCAITGANGYVGASFANYLRNKGLDVYELRRSAVGNQLTDLHYVPYTLNTGVEPDKLKCIDILIHCAYDFRLTNWRDIVEINVNGSEKLFTAAKQAGVRRIILISTMSAFEGCKSMYGRAKLMIEKKAAAVKALIIRPGLVYGKNAAGMVGMLKKAAESFKIIPLIGKGNQLLPLTHVDDLSDLAYKCCADSSVYGPDPIVAASETRKTFREILTILAKAGNKRPIFTQMPWFLIWSIIRMAEIVRLPIKFRSDSIISLLNQEQSPSFEATRSIGIRFGDFHESYC